MSLEEYLFSSVGFLPLYIEGAPAVFRTGTLINDNLPLYTQGNLGAAESLNLFIGGVGLPCSGSFDLYCHNAAIAGTLPLYISGEGENDNYIPANNSLLLYIKCAFGATLPLYMYGGPQPSVSDSLDFYMIGGMTTTGSLDLTIPNVVGTISGTTLNLYTHGF